MKPFAHPTLAKRNRGFTLLEMLVVIGLLGLVALGAASLIIDTGEEIRKDATEKNWNALRKAIIGDYTQSVNGSPYLSGYVADMGRLPNNIKELMSQEFFYDHDDNALTPSLSLVVQPKWQEIELNTVNGAANTGVVGKIYGGWRGPYLYTAGSDVFRDGWGNQSSDATGATSEMQYIPTVTPLSIGDKWLVEDVLNFGWNVTHSPNLNGANFECGDLHCEDMFIQSLGEGNRLNDVPNPSDNLDYSENFPATNTINIVSKNNWLLTTTLSFYIVFNKPPACTAPSPTCPEDNKIIDLDLRIFNFEDDGVVDVSPTNTPKDSVVMRSSNPRTEAQLIIPPPATAPDPTTFAVDASNTMVPTSINSDFPIGRYAAVIMCTQGTAVLTDDVIYDGDCDVTNKDTDTQTMSAYYFNVHQSTNQVTIPWNLP